MFRSFDRFLRMTVCSVALCAASAAFAYDPVNETVTGHTVPKELKNVSITEKLGAKIDLTTEFTSDTGETVQLGKYFSGQKPVFLTIVYFDCPSLCNYHLNGVTDSLKGVDLMPGKDFEIVAISMNHRETPALAAAKKASYLDEYGRHETANGWHFLTGTEANVKKVADEVGFGFEWNEKQQQYAHAAAAYVMSPEGMISRYLYGIEFKPQTLRLALLEAGQGKIGNLIDQIVLFCFQFNPAKNKYTLYAWNIMRISGVLAMVGLAIFLVPVWMRERRMGTKVS